MAKKYKYEFSDENRQPSYRINNDKKLFEEIEQEKRLKKEEKLAVKQKKAALKQKKIDKKIAIKQENLEAKIDYKEKKKLDKDRKKARKEEIKQSKKEEKKVQKLLSKQYAKEAREDRKEIKKYKKQSQTAEKNQKQQADYLDYEQLLVDGVKIDIPPSHNEINDKKSDKKNFKINLRIFYKFIIAVIACTAVALIAINFNSLIPDSVITGIQGFFTDTGDDYPVDISEYNVIDANGWNEKNLLLLTDTSLVAFSKKGDLTFERNHGYDSPQIKKSGKYVLTYESLGHGIRLDTESKTVYDNKIESNIITADVSSEGKIAVVTGTEGYNAKLSVYDSSYKQQDFKWYSAENSVVNVAISKNGKNAAVITVSADNGKVVSHLIILDFTKSKPVATIDYSDTMLFSVCFKNNDKSIALVGDNICSAVQVNDPDKHVEYNFDDSNLISFNNDTDSDSVLLALNQHSDFSAAKVVMISSSGKVEFSNDIDGEVINTSLDKKIAAVMTNSKVLIINNSGKVINKYDSSNEYRKVLNFSNQCFLTGNSTIDFCKNNS